MAGTLNAALEVRQVTLRGDDFRCEVEGVNESVEGFPILREIRVHYRLRAPGAAREAVERALAKHMEKCPTARTLAPAIKVSWTAEIEDADELAKPDTESGRR